MISSNPMLYGALPGQIIAADPACHQRLVYPLRFEKKLRWSELENGGISRVAFAQFFEDTRMNLMDSLVGVRQIVGADLKAVARVVTMEHICSGNEWEPLELTGAISNIGNSSFTFALAAFQADRCLALCRAVGVTVDRHMKPASTPADIREPMKTALWTGAPTPKSNATALPDTVEAYPFRTELPSRFSDTDALGHINNVALIRYHDDGYMAFQKELLTTTPGLNTIGNWKVTRQEVLMQAETFHPLPITLCVSIEYVAEDHFALIHGLFQNGKCTSHMRSTITLVNRHNATLRIPQELHAVLAKWATVTEELAA